MQKHSNNREIDKTGNSNRSEHTRKTKVQRTLHILRHSKNIGDMMVLASLVLLVIAVLVMSLELGYYGETDIIQLLGEIPITNAISSYAFYTFAIGTIIKFLSFVMLKRFQ